MSHHVGFPELAKTLKRLLKARKITYRALAKRLGLSESSVKKLFIAEDCSLERLNAICTAAEVSLPDLLVAARERTPEKLRFTEAQERFLVKNRRSFQVYWKLVYEELAPERVCAELKIREADLFKILRGLDQLGLLELRADGSVRCPDMSMILWEPGGALVELARKEWAPLLVAKAAEGAGKEGYALGLRYFALREESAREFGRALEELQFEFGRRSVREKRLNAASTRPMVMVTAVTPGAFVELL